MRKIDKGTKHIIFAKALIMLSEKGVGIGGGVLKICKKMILDTDEYGRIEKMSDYKALSKRLNASIATTHKTVSMLLFLNIVIEGEEHYILNASMQELKG